MNIRRFRIAAFSIVVLLLVGIGAFVTYDRNAPVQQVKVYEVPDPIAPSVQTKHSTTGTTVSIATGQQGRVPSNTAVQYSAEYNQEDKDTASIGESATEPCCPEEGEQSSVSDIDFGQDTNLDHNPVTPELIADMKRDAEWYAAMKEYEKKYDALHAEGDVLDNEFDALLDKAAGLEGAALEALVPKLKAQIAKDEAWLKKLEALKQQRPVRPVPTHTH